MKIVWLGGYLNRLIAAELKARGYIDDYEANDVSTVLYINREKAEIPYTVVNEIVEKNTGRPLEPRIWRSMWINVQGGYVDVIDDTRVVLREYSDTQIGIRLPSTLRKKLEEKARKENKKLSDIVREALEKYVEK